MRDDAIAGIPADAGTEDPECYRTISDYCDLNPNECTRDTDCPGDALCIREAFDESSDLFQISHRCLTPCRTDADCASDELCACDYVEQNSTRTTIAFGLCMAADCRTDEDCGSGKFCSVPLNVHPLTGRTGELEPFHCQTDEDECHGPSICPAPSQVECLLVAACRYEAEHFVCGARNTNTNCSY